MSSQRDQISAGVTRYLRRYLHILSADIYELLSAYNTKKYYRGTTTMSSPPHADCALPKNQSRSLRSSRSSRPRRCSPPPPSRRHPAPSLSRPPSPRRASPSFFLGGAGECCCCHCHSRSYSPRRQGDTRRRRRQDGGRRQALPDYHLSR